MKRQTRYPKNAPLLVRFLIWNWDRKIETWETGYEIDLEMDEPHGAVEFYIMAWDRAMCAIKHNFHRMIHNFFEWFAPEAVNSAWEWTKPF